MSNYYERLSKERKELQEKGLLPQWYSTAGFQLFKQKYQWAENPYAQYMAIAATAAKHTDDAPKWKDKFFELLWNGWLSPSTPVLANMGTTRGFPVSCSGSYTVDSIDGFYSALHEEALLTKGGFGTSTYLGDIRPRGSRISSGGKASGIMPVLSARIQTARDVSQGGVRRGADASYIPLSHGDFEEAVGLLEHNPDDLNIGWVLKDSDIEAITGELNDSTLPMKMRFAQTLKAKTTTGKGYYWKTDAANRKLPKYYPVGSKGSNLCSEINLPSDADHTFTCVLSSMNLALYDEWRDTDAIFTATVFLDCVASEFIAQARGIPGLERAVRFTEKARAIGLGVCGYHTYLQKQGWVFDGIDSMAFNVEFFTKLRDETLKASIWMAKEWGAPEWVKDYHKPFCDENGHHRGIEVRNCSRIAIAPTKSTALIMGGVSEGINPDVGFTYTQGTAAGEVDRVSPVILEIMKERGVYTTKHIKQMTDAFGSVQGVDWLSDEEKAVFRTAFEINQFSIVRMAGMRGRYIDQWQSLNLFFAGDAPSSYIRDVHYEALANDDVIGLYYLYSQSGVKGSDPEACEVCQ